MKLSIKPLETESSDNHGLNVVGLVLNDDLYVYSPTLPLVSGNKSTVESSALN